MSTPELLAESDAKMIAEMSVSNYFKYIFQTVAERVQVIGLKVESLLFFKHPAKNQKFSTPAQRA